MKKIKIKGNLWLLVAILSLLCQGISAQNADEKTIDAEDFKNPPNE
jgi:hypothetical protein